MDITTQKIETIVGVSALLAVVIIFLVFLFNSLPKDAQVNAVAKPIPPLSEDIFKPNDLSNKIGDLSVPSGLPITISPSNLGRDNAFKKL